VATPTRDEFKERQMKMGATAVSENVTRVAKQWFEEIPEGGFAGIIAHAGIGKTAFLVQLALAQMTLGQRVLHVSLHDQLKKVHLWYEEMFNHFRGTRTLQPVFTNEEGRINRFIMTFQEERFSCPRLEERLAEFKEQEIFRPDLILIDGLHFLPALRPTLEGLRSLARREKMRVWFTIHSHRNETPLPNGMPPGFVDLADLFGLVWQIRQEGEKLHLVSLLGSTPGKGLSLNPTTMLIED
jgi:hypothetical protein